MGQVSEGTRTSKEDPMEQMTPAEEVLELVDAKIKAANMTVTAEAHFLHEMLQGLTDRIYDTIIR